MSVRQKLLVVGPAWVGDMVMAQSLYKLLRRRFDPEIHVVAPPWSSPLLGRMPEVTRAIELPVAHGELALGKRWALGSALKSESYDRAIILPRSAKAALVPFFAGIPVRTGFRGEARYGLVNDMRPFNAARLDQTVKRFVALGCERGEDLPAEIDPPVLEARPDSLAALAARLGLAREGCVVAMMAGAEYGGAKQWPLERYGALAERLARAGFRVWILGSAKERAGGETIRSVAGSAAVHNLCGETTLDEAADLLSAAAAAVTNDSGLMHVAAAVGTHVVAIYGSSSPHFTPPLTSRKTIVYLELECSPCFERECPLHHLRCLRDISVDAIFDAVIAAATGGAPQPGMGAAAGEAGRSAPERGAGHD